MNDNFRVRARPWIVYGLFKTKRLNIDALHKITFSDLIYLSYKINNGEYENLMGRIIELQEMLLRKKAKSEKIKVGFMGDSSNVWGFDDIYKALDEDIHYEPYVIIPLRAINKERTKDMRIMKREAVSYFQRKKMKYYIVSEKRDSKWGKKMPDILLSQVPYEEAYYQDNFCLGNMPCSCIQVFVPYTFWITRTLDADFASAVYMKIFSKIFLPSKLHKEFFEKAAGIGDKRLFYSGYPKLDVYYREKSTDENKVWKNGEGKVHIIYAPGLMQGVPEFSTFNLNYMRILDIAKQTKDTVSWVVRLHPLMALSCLQQGVFANMQEWDSYIGEWENLENARVSIHGSYQDIFHTSDGMIMDSVSFLPSYQYVHKPLLLLTRTTQKMNALGALLKRVVYTAEARDMEGIESFIDDVIIDGKDEKKEIREKFFKENLDYYYENGQLASDYIADEIKNLGF